MEYKKELENNIWSQFFVENLNSKIDESNNTFKKHVIDTKLNMNKSLEKNKKKIEVGTNEQNSDFKDQKRYIMLESLIDNSIDELANDIGGFEKSFQFEIEPGNPKRLARYEQFYTKLMELSPDKSRLIDAKEKIKDVKENYAKFLQSKVLEKVLN
eukprot:Mrub_12947.p1 GENE.Mrub_12947~~Mrub_12947.p1  ORF type:complete len:175 (-),score=49.70 Mrub_12947:11-478(-)